MLAKLDDMLAKGLIIAGAVGCAAGIAYAACAASLAPSPDPPSPALTDCRAVRLAWGEVAGWRSEMPEAVACRWRTRWCWVTPGAATILVTWCEP